MRSSHSMLIFYLILSSVEHPHRGSAFELLPAHLKWDEDLKNALNTILFLHPDLLFSRILHIIPHFVHF
jgi:hypothetical protein